jgi:hypothetical protein
LAGTVAQPAEGEPDDETELPHSPCPVDALSRRPHILRSAGMRRARLLPARGEPPSPGRLMASTVRRCRAAEPFPWPAGRKRGCAHGAADTVEATRNSKAGALGERPAGSERDALVAGAGAALDFGGRRSRAPYRGRRIAPCGIGGPRATAALGVAQRHP